MNFLDLIILGVLALSALLAFSRGFVKEMLSILGWIGAVVATIMLFAPARIHVRQYITEPLLADIATGIGIFVITLFLCGLVNHWLSGHVRNNGLGALDRSLGLVFGLVRGAVVICAAYILMAWVMPDREERPDIVNEARTLPVVERGAAYLLTLLPEDILKQGEEALGQGLKAVEQGQAIGNAIGTIQGSPAPDAPLPGANAGPQSQEPGGQDAGSGYKDAERNDLNRLIQGTQ
ncbi:membrane protein required for colicin V production [Dongia mobilis]|uniref:Membrane protein required for colicin V production n=1 Tax=Dongia mobilis TaxID=578943 RepID=A0A4R6WJ05_9PROT|nr:CvpA family protein [Dongia mobilis]TDQ78490.1 membrane protein required for colicin V production [Dongia mobilis]